MSGLRLLGIVFVLLAAFSAIGLGSAVDFAVLISLASILSSTFFAAICFVLDDIRALLKKIALAAPAAATALPPHLMTEVKG